MTPRSRTDSERPRSASWSNVCRGWRGFGAIRSTGRRRSSGVAALPSAGIVGERIAARPRPIPRLALATCGHLLGELEVGLRARAVRVVMDDRDPIARSLPQAHVARDHGVEHERREVRADLALDILRELR